jgi:hypothetical protein
MSRPATIKRVKAIQLTSDVENMVARWWTVGNDIEKNVEPRFYDDVRRCWVQIGQWAQGASSLASTFNDIQLREYMDDVAKLAAARARMSWDKEF